MKNIFSFRTSRARMLLLFIVDILAITFDTYVALAIRFKLDNFYYGIVPQEYMQSVNKYVNHQCSDYPYNFSCVKSV